MNSYAAYHKENEIIKTVASNGSASLSNRWDAKLALVHFKAAEKLATTGLYEIFSGPDGQRMIRKTATVTRGA